MKKILSIFFLVTCISYPILSKENDYKKIFGSEKEGYFFISLSSIQTKQGTSFFTYLHNLPNKNKFGDLSYLTSIEAECKSYKYRVLGSQWYSQNFGKGILNVEYSNKSEWQIAEKKTFSRKFIDYSCNK